MEEALGRGWENLLGRFDGPLDFRLILQPAVAVFLAVRSGLQDARQGNPPFLWTILSNADQRHELMRHGWKDVGAVFIVAIILDVIYQIIMHASIYPLELLVTAAMLAILPYVFVRGLVTRLTRRLFVANRASNVNQPGDIRSKQN
jgi:hypothetical protein